MAATPQRVTLSGFSLALVALGSLLLGPAVSAEGRRAVPVRSPIVVTLGDQSDGALHVEGRFTARVKPEVAWRVLTDYESIPRFVSSMRSSRIQSRSQDSLLLEQTSIGHLLFIERLFHVLLRVEETPPQAIRFTDVSAKSFDRYEGGWKIEARDNGIEVTYSLVAKGGFAAAAMTRGASRRMVDELLGEVRDEMVRRELLEAHGRLLPPGRNAG